MNSEALTHRRASMTWCRGGHYVRSSELCDKSSRGICTACFAREMIGAPKIGAVIVEMGGERWRIRDYRWGADQKLYAKIARKNRGRTIERVVTAAQFGTLA